MNAPQRFEDIYPNEAKFLMELYAGGWIIRWVFNRFGIMVKQKSIDMPFKYKVDSAHKPL